MYLRQVVSDPREVSPRSRSIVHHIEYLEREERAVIGDVVTIRILTSTFSVENVVFFEPAFSQTCGCDTLSKGIFRKVLYYSRYRSARGMFLLRLRLFIVEDLPCREDNRSPFGAL